MPADVRDNRRQTGPGRLLDAPGAALEVHVPGERRDALEAAWRRHARALADALGWTDTPLVARSFSRGLSLAVGAPLDALYTAGSLNEAAVRMALSEIGGTPAPDITAAVAALRAERDEERDPALVALARAAEAQGVELLWDDEHVTAGSGASGVTWPAPALPAPEAVAWDTVRDVPTALVTGTNGKSTTARLLAAMGRAAGHTPGLSTTDYVAVGDDIIERGDFSGPMGARAALRDGRVTLGVLEVARGGLLRRGVPVQRARAAAVTNVASDHLGEYGVETVSELAEVKFTVGKALQPGGVLVLCADDPTSVAEAERQAEALAARGLCLAWTSLDAAHPRLAERGLAAATVEGAFAVRLEGRWVPLVLVADAPATFGGAARHNVRNALTAVALGAALGLPAAALAAGLRDFRGSDADNPGRANRFDVGGAEVLVDYAHNAHGIAALAALAAGRPARRRLVLLSAPGDRSDDDLAAMAAAAAPLRADRYILADLPGYLRGRAPGEVPAVLAHALAAHGVDPAACRSLPDPPTAVDEALAWAQPGDGLLLFVLSHREEVLRLLRRAAGLGEGGG